MRALEPVRDVAALCRDPVVAVGRDREAGAGVGGGGGVGEVGGGVAHCWMVGIVCGVVGEGGDGMRWVGMGGREGGIGVWGSI